MPLKVGDHVIVRRDLKPPARRLLAARGVVAARQGKLIHVAWTDVANDSPALWHRSDFVELACPHCADRIAQHIRVSRGVFKCLFGPDTWRMRE